jgi:hypothetical protein
MMELLYEILPKDLAYIIDDYAKDRTKYDKVIKELKIVNRNVNSCIDSGVQEGFIKHVFTHLPSKTSLFLFTT